MTDIPKGAIEKADEVLEHGRLEHYLVLRDRVARFIADVSEKAREAVEQSTFAGQLPAHIAPLQSLILPDPESDLLKEAREICARDAEEGIGADNAELFRSGQWDNTSTMRCTLAALKHRKDG